MITSTIGPAAEGGIELRVQRPAPKRWNEPGDMRYLSSLAGRRVVLAGGFDLVHIHASAFSPLGFLTAPSTAGASIPTVVTLHSLWAYASPLFRAAQGLTGWDRWPVVWSAVSTIAAQPLQRIVGPTKPVAILPNGVDAPWWRTAGRPRSPGRVVIATVGRLAPRKRLHPLLKMLRRVRADLPVDVQLEVVVIGEGPQRRSLQRYIALHGMDSWVRLPGPADHDQIRSVYEGADFYVAPATLESFGIAALEARCAGLPIVAYAATGVADFINHGVEGLLARDDAEMIASILRLATSRRTVERMRRHNIDNAPAITWPGVLDQCEALYEQAAMVSAAVPRLGRPKSLQA